MVLCFPGRTYTVNYGGPQVQNKNLFLKAILFLQSLNDLIQNHNADKIRECCIKTKFIY